MKVIKQIQNSTIAVFMCLLCIGSVKALSFADAVEKASPSVVSIKTQKEIPVEMHPFMRDPFFKHFFGESMNVPESKELLQGLGSGVVISKDGYILTNQHVVQDADSVSIKLSNGKELDAKVIGGDSKTDLAVLKVDAKDLPAASLGKSSNLRVGEVVLAIGNPFGVGQTVTQGIVSAFERRNTELDLIYDRYIQTDAAINPGNSGGALIDVNGNVVGINTAIISRTGGHQGIGFAIPIDEAKGIMEELIANGSIKRGWIGISISNLTKEIKDFTKYNEDYGVYVSLVYNRGPAAAAGIQPGDIIMKIGDKKPKDGIEAVRLISALKPNTSHIFEIYRNRDIAKVNIRIGDNKK